MVFARGRGCGVEYRLSCLLGGLGETAKKSLHVSFIEECGDGVYLKLFYLMDRNLV